MASLLRNRHVRHLSLAAAATPTVAATTMTLRKAKVKLRSEFDPDKALEIYNSLGPDRDASPHNFRYVQDVTVKRLAKSHRFADIETIIDSQKKLPKITQESFLSTLIRSYGQVAMFDHALKTYCQMDQLGTPRSVLSFNALLTACNESKLYDRVPDLFYKLPEEFNFNFAPDKVSYGILVKSYCESGSPDKAMETLQEMEDNGTEVTAITFTTILDALYKRGEREDAERLWCEMKAKGCPPDVAAYNVKIMHVQDQHPEVVKALIKEMSDLGLKPSTISYNYLMTSYCKSGVIEEAKKVYEGLAGNGCHPNAATFRTLIFHLCRADEYEEAYKVFRKSVRLHKIPDFGTLRHLLMGLVKKSNKKEAIEMTRTVKNKFPENLLNAWVMLEKELGLTASPDADSFWMDLDDLYKKGKREEAERLWCETKDKGYSPDVVAYNVKITHVQDPKPESVRALIKEMSDFGLRPNIVSYNHLMTSYCESRMMEEAKKVYEGLKENGCSPTTATFNTLILHLCRAEEFEEAYKVFKKSVQVNRVPNFPTTRDLLTGLVEKSNRKDAKEMTKAVRKKLRGNALESWMKLERDLGLAEV